MFTFELRVWLFRCLLKLYIDIKTVDQCLCGELTRPHILQIATSFLFDCMRVSGQTFRCRSSASACVLNQWISVLKIMHSFVLISDVGLSSIICTGLPQTSSTDAYVHITSSRITFHHFQINLLWSFIWVSIVDDTLKMSCVAEWSPANLFKLCC